MTVTRLGPESIDCDYNGIEFFAQLFRYESGELGWRAKEI
jgi:hypothetical protein